MLANVSLGVVGGVTLFTIGWVCWNPAVIGAAVYFVAALQLPLYIEVRDVLIFNKL
jgi:hypothetical protein